jgi:hypothetical protein
MTDQVETPSPNQESTTPTPEAGSEDEAVNAFTKRDTKAESTDEPEPGPDDEATEEGADAEPEEAEDEGATGEEVEFEGKTYKNVPPELRKALLRQADYSRSMNEVSAQKKEYTQRIETAERLIEGAEQFAKALAKVDNLDTQLKAFEKVNWQELRASNPAEFAATAAELQMLRVNRDEALREAQGLESKVVAERRKDMVAKRDTMLKTLVKDVPGWGEELGTKVTQYALASSASTRSGTSPTHASWLL